MRNALANSVRAFDSVSDLACEGDVVAACGTWCSSVRVGLWRSLEKAKSFD